MRRARSQWAVEAVQVAEGIVQALSMPNLRILGSHNSTCLGNDERANLGEYDEAHLLLGDAQRAGSTLPRSERHAANPIYHLQESI